MSEKAEGGLSERITDYLSGGGLFNPELANHDAVRNLLIDCRGALQSPSPEREAVIHALFERATGYTVKEYEAMVEGVKNGN